MYVGTNPGGGGEPAETSSGVLRFSQQNQGSDLKDGRPLRGPDLVVVPLDSGQFPPPAPPCPCLC